MFSNFDVTSLNVILGPGHTDKTIEICSDPWELEQSNLHVYISFIMLLVLVFKGLPYIYIE